MKLLYACAAALALSAACKGSAERSAPAAASSATASAATAARSAALASKERFAREIRPILNDRGCTAGTCHGTFKGGGLYLTNSPDDFASVEAVIDVDRPDESLLLRKALARIDHVGGKNLGEADCDTRKIRAWIAGDATPDCASHALTRPLERFAREVAPALRALGCASARCHAMPDDAAAKRWLDGTGLNAIAVWKSPAVAAALGDRPSHPAPKEPASCAMRRLFAYASGSPEERCAIDTPLRPALDRAAFREKLLPMLARRGCFDGSCHGGGAGALPLFPPSDARAELHDYLLLTSRIEPASPAERTTLLAKARNDVPHGGGRRLGGEGDCLDAALRAWLRRAPIAPCKRIDPPPFDAFVAEIQGVLDRMTCTRSACHGADRPHAYRLIAHATRPEDLRANYEQTLAQIDLEYMPFSQVMLRMREPCAYSVVGAWIERKPRPACPLVDPDPRLFPRVDDDGAHPSADMMLPE